MRLELHRLLQTFPQCEVIVDLPIDRKYYCLIVVYQRLSTGIYVVV